MLRIFFNFCHFAVEVFTWQRSTREQGYPVVSYPQSFRIQIQSIRTQFEYPRALVLPLSLFTVYTFKPVYDAYCSMLPCHVSEVRGEVMDIIRHLTMLHPVATFLYGADWLLQRVSQTPAPDVKSMVQSYFWIKLSSARERDLVTSASARIIKLWHYEALSFGNRRDVCKGIQCHYY